MDIHTDQGKSSLSFENALYNHAEDSGYNTFTPGSFESPDISQDIFSRSKSNLVTTITGQIQIECHVTPEVIKLHRLYNNSIPLQRNLPETPPIRRGHKRSFSNSENEDIFSNSIPTPTSLIAGKIQSLHVNEKKEIPITLMISEKKENSLLHAEFEQLSRYPTTPVKRNCKGPCKVSSKKLDFTTHSILCESNGLQFNNRSKSIKKPRILPKTKNNVIKSNQKLDIISKLYEECGTGPPIMKILSLISCEDILNFNLVSRKWNDIWDSVSEDNELKQQYRQYLRIAKENQENKNKLITPKRKHSDTVSVLRNIQNDIVDNSIKVIVRSPPGTPRSNKFKKFTKSASLDSRIQMSCVRCGLPSKVTEEPSGEVWVECTSWTCSYKFCKHCSCERHPGTSCIRYDLNGPSPSKRKKNYYGVCTKKSRRNLHRLL